MRCKRDCCDNAPVERSSGKLKSEWGHGKTYATRKEAGADVFKSVELFYNHKRKRQALGYLSPVAFEGRYHNASMTQAA